ncbi:MAG TPA: hypothetical protein VFE13_08770 [Caulobacteraceae bacterium]|nr:hypothetical protein [Caulobacteraceae bacterium]
MRSALLTAALLFATLLFAGAATAAPTPAPAPGAPIGPPKVFRAAGYSQPDIGPAQCKVVNASEVQCVVPAMTAGAYLVRAAASSTAQAADAAQQLTIVAGDQSCTSTRSPDAKAPWAVGSARTFQSACVFRFLTDTPLTIAVIYLDAKAAKDPKGPQVTIARASWTGVLGSAMPVSVPQR